MEKLDFSREKSETNNQYQLINSDTSDNEVHLFAKFDWRTKSSEDIVVGFFKLINKSKSPGYVLNNVLWCTEHKRLEAHITMDPDNMSEEQTLKRKFRDVFTCMENEEVKFVWRITDNIYENPRPVCENLNGNLSPDDKDGSILVGQRP